MMEKPKSHDFHSRQYPVREDMEFQLKVWRFERWGWYVMLLVVMLALLGLFSSGPLSSRQVQSADGRIGVQYERFHRNGAINPMIIQVKALPNTPVQLELLGNALQGFSIETLQPQPLRSTSAGQGIKFLLQADAEGYARIYLTLRGEGLGFYHTRVVTAGAEPLDLDQFIYP
ncbi:hypothetical protein [Pseudomonas fluorescens]|nr:hypothetical protein [Pseudomonas fluorescens]